MASAKQKNLESEVSGSGQGNSLGSGSPGACEQAAIHH